MEKVIIPRELVSIESNDSTLGNTSITISTVNGNQIQGPIYNQSGNGIVQSFGWASFPVNKHTAQF